MIGFLDSGVGGLTILEEVHKVIPEYDTLYLGDTAHAPYGNKTHDELVALVWNGCTWLFAQGCELIILACNSASASALREIQQTKLQEYPGKRILGVIRPTVEELARSGHKRVVVLSTVATKESGAYPREFKKLGATIEVITHACPQWVPMIEAGKAASDEMREDVLREIAAFEQEAGEYDAVLLACTHYPYVHRLVEQALARKVPVYNQGELVARSLADYLKRHPEIESKLGNHRAYRYVTTGDAQLASKIATDRFGFEVTFSHA